RKIEGKVAAANKGTLFLDEVAELPSSAQSKLLQLLQSKEYFPLGASKPMVADVRLITATNSNLKEAVAEKRFREDLYYRLEVMPIRMPSLAERREDVADLAVHFVRQACERNNFARLEISAGGLRAIQTAEWPGNVRQLAHTMEASAIRATAEGSLAIERNHVFPPTQAKADVAEPTTFQEASRRFQSEFLQRALDDADWNVTEVAKNLDLARSHVYNLIRAFGLKRGTR
ncbi:MAG: sigma 54-interacting transcriptional regulator, partial [Candidatus Binatia bacterium]